MVEHDPKATESHSSERIAWSTPGKLMLSGEYAVVHVDAPCLSIATTGLANGQLGRRTVKPTITIDAFGVRQAHPESRIPNVGIWSLVRTALEQIRAQSGLQPKHDLEMVVGGHIAGTKVGLGTSASLTVHLVDGLSKSCEIALDRSTRSDLAMSIHLQHQGGFGSGYDVATVLHGGCIAYRRTPALVEPLQWPRGLYAAALFSGQPADTRRVLAAMTTVDRTILERIGARSEQLLDAWASADHVHTLSALRACQQVSDELTVRYPTLQSTAIAKTVRCIEAGGGIARTSGAGGGDCVLAFAANRDVIDQIVASWGATGGHCVARLPDDLAMNWYNDAA
jgi:phosphomevalonate kinase